MRARPGAERKLEPPWAIGVGDTEKVLTPKRNDAEVGKRGRKTHASPHLPWSYGCHLLANPNYCRKQAMGPQGSEQEKGTKTGAAWPKVSIASESNNSNNNRMRMLVKGINLVFKML